eukprot:2224458-Pyramimonas_sp.AAC.1
MAEVYSVAAMKRGTEEGEHQWKVGELSAKSIDDIGAYLVRWRYFVQLAKVVYAVAAGVQREANWQERCWCHEHVFESSDRSLSFVDRLNKYRKVARHCDWKCRRGCELAAGHWQTHINNIRDCTSRDLQKLYMECSDDERRKLQALERELKTSITEQLHLKLSPWGKLPLKLLGIYVHMQSGSLDRARE